MTRAVLLVLLLLAPALARAVDSPSEMLPNPAQEARAEAIGSQLRCLVCQNESIEDSRADLARDLRHVVRVHVAAGESNRQIIAWIAALGHAPAGAGGRGARGLARLARAQTAAAAFVRERAQAAGRTARAELRS